MYFPFLRGKQFELLALKEVCGLLKPINKIHPVIEPVKESFQALERSLTELCCNDISPTVIVNPSVGEIGAVNAAKLHQFVQTFIKSNQLNVGFLISGLSDLSKVAGAIEKYYSHQTPLTFIYHGEVGIRREDISGLLQSNNVVYNIVDEANSRSFKRIFEPATKINLNDPFPKAERNADYAKSHDVLLTEEHHYFPDEGLAGYSDYLTVGKEYKDSGFLPYAVAIHLTYAVQSGEEIRLRHFVSDSNDDDSNVAGKFFEALKKLVDFSKSLPDKTAAIQEFEDLYRREHYPGLGYIKKLSILNHLELVNKLLQ